MRMLAVAVMAAWLVGCSTSPTEPGKPVMSAQTGKDPQLYTQCLASRWQQFDPAASSVQTPTGYETTVSAMFTGAMARAEVVQESAGSKVEVYLPQEWQGTTAWTNMATACL